MNNNPIHTAAKIKKMIFQDKIIMHQVKIVIKLLKKIQIHKRLITKILQNQKCQINHSKEKFQKLYSY